jgi:hypothetical protein
MRGRTDRTGPMARGAPFDVYTEVGSKRAFAGAIEWPGWCRRGRDTTTALQALMEYAPRYARALRGEKPAFQAPRSVEVLHVVEHLEGDATTDFGAPSIAPKADARPMTERELARQLSLLRATWSALDRAARNARHTALRKGPRGGGRDLEAIVAHVVGADTGYVRRLATKPPDLGDGPLPSAVVAEVRDVVLGAVTRAVREGLPAEGPRGGKLWSPRYFVRRSAWHALDHAWEIEDRS